MREKPRDKERLEHILDAISTIKSKSASCWETAIATDPVAYYGLCKLIEIIGEATFKLTKEFRDGHPEVPWEIIEGMRHVIVHDYFVISKRMLIQVVTKDLDSLEQQIRQILLSFPGEE